MIFRVSVQRISVNAVEIAIQRIEVLNRNRVELVGMASAAVQSQPHKHCSRCNNSIHCVSDFDLIIDRTAFSSRHMTAIESGRNQLSVRWLRQQIASELF